MMKKQHQTRAALTKVHVITTKVDHYNNLIMVKK